MMQMIAELKTLLLEINVEVYARIMPLMVKTLKLCDAMESRY